MVSSSFPLLALIVFVVFLGVLGGLAIAVTKTVNPDGRAARGFFGALGSSLALLFLCGLGFVGTAAFAFVLFVHTAMRENPIERIELYRDGAAPEVITPGGFDRATAYRTDDGTHLLLTVRPGTGEHLIDSLGEVLGIERCELRDNLWIHEEHTANGRVVEVVEIRLPISERDFEEFERELQRELDGLDVTLPDGVAIDLRARAY